MNDKKAEVTGVVSIDGKRIGVLNEMKTDSKTGIISMRVYSIPTDVELITPQQALEKGLINEHDYRKMVKEQDNVKEKAARQAEKLNKKDVFHVNMEKTASIQNE